MAGVAPLAGAWVEIIETLTPRELQEVAPLAGAWVEISVIAIRRAENDGRSPRGGVG